MKCDQNLQLLMCRKVSLYSVSNDLKPGLYCSIPLQVDGTLCAIIYLSVIICGVNFVNGMVTYLCSSVILYIILCRLSRGKLLFL